jgi:hypothetical protein
MHIISSIQYAKKDTLACFKKAMCLHVETWMNFEKPRVLFYDSVVYDMNLSLFSNIH